MINFFPMPYPDESMYNIFVRYNKLTGNYHYRNTISELTGKANTKINFKFGINLDYLCTQLPEDTTFSSDYFIQNHTILPIYKSFVYDKNYKNAISNFKNNFHSVSNSMSSIGYFSVSLYRTNGFSYCPNCIKDDTIIFGEAYIHRQHQIDGNFFCNKHKTPLCIYEIPKLSPSNVFYDINELHLYKEDHELLHEYENKLLNLSYNIEKLFNYYSLLPDFSATREKYCSMLYNKGYYFKSGFLNRRKLHSDFIDYYSPEFLNYIKSDVDASNERSWLITITRNNIISVHPITNLLFINFLFDKIENFIDYSITDMPKKIINQKPKELCKNESYYLKKELYKNKLLNLLQHESTLSRTQIAKRLGRPYEWLYKNEREYLESIVPRPLETKKNRIDWNKKDTHYYDKVKEAITHIINLDIPIRITIKSISDYINYRSLYENLHKMPKTKSLVDNYCESIPDFHKRKIKIVYSNMVKNGETITPSKLIRRTNINKKYYYSYYDYLNDLFDINTIET